jgi:cell division protein FtsL
MNRVSVILLFVLLASAIGMVTSQHRARKLYAELDREQQLTKQIDME